jgi:hypothetical protein
VKNIMSGKNGGFLLMVFGILGLVLWTTLFTPILDAFTVLASLDYVSNYIAFEVILKITPAILFLAGIFGGVWLQYKGYKQAMGSGISSLLVTVLGALEIILFVTLFGTVMAGIESIRTADNITYYIALGTVVAIAPAILFLTGIFSGGAMAVGGWKNSKKGKTGAEAVA